MEDLLEIYKRIEYLRNNGVKMKEMADHTQMPASVLSSLYSAVLPAYVSTLKKGNSAEEALDYALGQVNNVSKKRLLGNLQELKERLFELEPAPAAAGLKDNPLLNMLNEDMPRSAQEAYNYSGIYISYSLSSSSNTLKIEPYLITASEKNDYVRVVHMSAYNTTHTGVALFNNHQTAYLLFNEREMPQIALFTIYLQLPMYDFPTALEDFLELKGRLVPREELTDELLPYYNYTCQPGDCIKTCTVPSPRLDANDLEREKKLLEI